MNFPALVKQTYRYPQGTMFFLQLLLKVYRLK